MVPLSAAKSSRAAQQFQVRLRHHIRMFVRFFKSDGQRRNTNDVAPRPLPSVEAVLQKVH
jgi:hypothetical protein